MSFATINGIRTFYTVKGEGTPIIFVHPPLLSSVCFSYQIRGLSHEFKTIAFDIRGNGQSDPSQQPLTYPLIAEDIKELMNYLKIEKAYLCGYSTGSSVILEFLLKYPDRALGAILVGGLSEVHDFRLKARIYLGVILTKLKAIKLLSLVVSRQVV